MKLKKKPTVVGSFLGVLAGLLYTIYSYSNNYTSNSNLIIFLIANILYFSLLGFILATIFNLATNPKKAEKIHVAALLGFIAFLIIISLTSIKSSGLVCRNLNAVFNCNFNQFLSFMILEGPFPLHLLQIFLILLGILIGLLLQNKDLIRFKK